MKQEIRALLDDKLLNEAAERFGLRRDSLINLHGFQNFVFGAMDDRRQARILRLTHTSHRTASMIQAELDWIWDLADHEVPAARPIRTRDHKPLAEIGSGNASFIVTAFEKAPGAKPDYRTYAEDERFIRQLGRFTGKIHARTKMYIPKPSAPIRSDWSQNQYLREFASYVTEAYSEVVDKKERFMEQLSALPKDPDSFGLIHGDIHQNNVHADGDRLTLFDFDECEYGWFAADIANSLFYATPLPSDGKDRREQAARRFYDSFMEGYCRENSLSAEWQRRIPLFLRLRELLVYAGAFRSLDLNRLHPWSKEMLEFTTNNMLHDLPFLDIDFA
ncbi:phosphotransferase enzyme family protein [Paenibacillus ginsengarvi]|uniref:Aminoglycoside phosphotransferase domain-containing protein n=1 Tax=Paenibacillus ginsengarvi TaxID=400777 RepID=A0A3B0CIT3_9BACL|nr:phosphotransferase [Paenibacillus ginsengarvi]RKN84751.1 hypothetical protein D7M11_12235 [Paenibacillus ginsengarvi]